MTLKTKHAIAVTLIVLLVCSLASAATNDGLSVSKIKWKNTGRHYDDPNYLWLAVEGTVQNTGQIRYKSVRIEISIIDRKKGEKLQTTQVAWVDNVFPGDKCKWVANPPICVDIADARNNRFVGRVDRVEGYVDQ